MSSFGQLMLSLPASIFWIAALLGVFAFHCLHLSRGCIDCRLLHWAHVAMLLGMICMFVEMAFGTSLAPGRFFFLLYASISIGVLLWISLRYLRHETVEVVWLLALMQQLAMIYMWRPMENWAPVISYGFSVYFALETMSWVIKTTGLSWQSGRQLAGVALAQNDMGSGSHIEDICMAIMAASMAYMFFGMQIIMTTPYVSEGGENAAILSPDASPQISSSERLSSQSAPGGQQQTMPLTLPPANRLPITEYVIRRGDTLSGIANRLYHDPRLWSRIANVNPGIDPRRLAIGRKINLPEPVSEP